MVGGGARGARGRFGLGDARQARRRDLDRLGWVPWQLITVLAGIGALAAAVVALKT